MPGNNSEIKKFFSKNKKKIKFFYFTQRIFPVILLAILKIDYYKRKSIFRTFEFKIESGSFAITFFGVSLFGQKIWSICDNVFR